MTILEVWRDPVWSKVIAAVLFAALCALWAKRESLRRLIRLPARPKPRTLLFLSKGGTCRDPMAKAILEFLLKGSSLKKGIKVLAAGIGPVDRPVSYAARHAVKELFKEDLLRDAEATQLTPQMVAEADLILVMDASLLSAVKLSLPADKTYVLKEFLGVGGDIIDPFPDGKDSATLARYMTCARDLRDVLGKHLDKIVQALDA